MDGLNNNTVISLNLNTISESEIYLASLETEVAFMAK